MLRLIRSRMFKLFCIGMGSVLDVSGMSTVRALSVKRLDVDPMADFVSVQCDLTTAFGDLQPQVECAKAANQLVLNLSAVE